jgi:hypothetical protein
MSKGYAHDRAGHSELAFGYGDEARPKAEEAARGDVDDLPAVLGSIEAFHGTHPFAIGRKHNHAWLWNR